jgi:hypothetical protein
MNSRSREGERIISSRRSAWGKSAEGLGNAPPPGCYAAQNRSSVTNDVVSGPAFPLLLPTELVAVAEQGAQVAPEKARGATQKKGAPKA